MMNYDNCPFCTDSNFLASFTKGDAEMVKVLIPAYMRQDKFWKKGKFKRADYTVNVEAERRGNRLRIIFDKENLDYRWRDFTIEVLGIQSVGGFILPRDDARVVYSPPPPFFFVSTAFQGEGQPFAYQQFFVCRITHKNSDASIIVHWWTNHDRVMRVDSSLSLDSANDSLSIIKTACDLFQRETRGNPKISEVELIKAIQKHGKRATQANVAKELGVGDRTLRDWTVRMGMSWERVKGRYQKTEIW
jgi:hypothetical protein